MDGVKIKTDLLGLTQPALKELMEQLKQPAYRAEQLFEWLHQKRVTDFEEMTNLPLDLRDALQQNCYIEQPAVVSQQRSDDGTQKLLLQYQDGEQVEAVLMRHHHGNSLCVSTQVGCRMACGFCASGQKGLVRPLTAGEMVAELYTVVAATGLPISHLVMMGIGEPLDNLDNVLCFIDIITSQDGYNMAGRNLTLSTCGLIPGMDKLAAQQLSLTLSVSLHAAFDEVRTRLMPVNKAYPIEALMQACQRYTLQTGRRISFEYALIDGVNDGEKDARALAAWLAEIGPPRSHLNLIRLNQVEEFDFTPSSEEAVEAFKNYMEKHGVNTTVRRRLGDDIAAACGQLRAQNMK